MYVRLSICPPLWAIQPDLKPGWLGQRPGWLGLRPGWLGLRPGWLGLRPGWLGLRPGWMAQRGERTDRRTDIRRENLPILQDFVSYRGPLPCFPKEDLGQ